MERKKASDYPQELLDLFHEYQHGEISRRDFLDRAKKYAVGGVTALALYESLKPNYAWAQQVKKDDQRITTETVTVPSPEGNGSIKGHFAKPGKARGTRAGVGRSVNQRDSGAPDVCGGRGASIRSGELHRVRARWSDVGRRVPGQR